ncbi:pilus assembly protein [Pseudonocardia sediminis]|uniref:pilus assembly protein n=1 Tax=Pseudonocardia sediminis TaxID=1397368 RepID=UPI0013EF2D17|nr:pilus assembly protein [Pseudonocardia sediminis]
MEAAVLTVVIGLLIALAIAGGRLVSAESAVAHAARSAARVASLQRDPASATAEARRAAELGLSEQGLHCTQTDVEVNAAGFSAPLGTPSSAEATVRCSVDWSDLGVPGTGTRTVVSSFSSPIDRWRERS